MESLIFTALGVLVLLVVMGVHVAVALGVVSALGVYLLIGSWDVAQSLLGTTAYEALRKDIFIVIPLFVLMGDFVSRSGAARDLYSICNRMMRRLPGRLAIATVSGNAIFAAITGVSIAAAATFSRIAYPEMVALGYKRTFALGVIAGSACLGMLIPPSILLIVWAILTEESIGALFIAGLVPGVLLAVAFCAYCVVASYFSPTSVPNTGGQEEAPLTPEELKSEMTGGLSILFLILLVIGGIWGGFLTPTEAAGFGAVGASIVGYLKGMRFKEFMEAIYGAGKTTAPIMILLITASMYSRFLAMAGAVDVIQGVFYGVSENPAVVIALIIAAWLVLGMFIDSVSIILLTVPIFAPMAEAMGIDAIAFAIFGILVIEAGLLTPPFGLLVFTVKAAVPDESVRLGEIFSGAIPYWILIIVVAVLVLMFPQLATWLPNNMM